MKGYCRYLFGGNGSSLSCFYFERRQDMKLKEFVTEVAKELEQQLEDADKSA